MNKVTLHGEGPDTLCANPNSDCKKKKESPLSDDRETFLLRL